MLLLGTAVTEGAGLFVLAAPFVGAVIPLWMVGLLLIGLGCRLLLWIVYHRRLSNGGGPLAVVSPLARFLPYFVVIAHGVPAGLVLAAAAVPSQATPLVALAGLAAVAGGWAMKIFVVTKIAMNQGFAITATPVRGRGTPGPGAFPGWR